jgi:hypothetical protein
MGLFTVQEAKKKRSPALVFCDRLSLSACPLSPKYFYFSSRPEIFHQGLHRESFIFPSATERKLLRTL